MTIDFFDLMILTTTYMSLTFWAYTTVFYEQLKLGIAYEGTFYLRRYTQGFLLFSLLNWFVCAVSLCIILGWIVGGATTAALFLGGMSLIAGITSNHIYKLIRLKADTSMMLLSILVWVQVALLIIRAFI